MRPNEHTSLIVGASVGAPHQRTSLALVRRHEVLLPHHDPENWDAAARRWKTPISFRVEQITRLRVGTALPMIVDRLNEAVPERKAVVELPRVGLSFYQLLKRRDIQPILLSDQPKRKRVLIPRHEIFGCLHCAIAEERLDLSRGGEVLQRALQSFLPGEQGADDDLVVALAVAIWAGATMASEVHQPPPFRPAINPGSGWLTFDQAMKRRRREQRRQRI